MKVVDGKWSVEDAGALPSATTADNGKVLKVVDGKWSAEDADLPAAGSDGYVLTSVKGEWKAAAAKKELPDVDSLYEDMVLKVVDGKWGVADLPQKKELPEAGENGDVLTVVDGEWQSAPPSDGGGQAEFATVTDVPAGGKRLDTDGIAVWEADSINLNGAQIAKEGELSKISGVVTPLDEYPFYVANKDYVDTKFASLGSRLPSGNIQAEFATVTDYDWGKNLETEGRLHLNADTIMVNNASFAVGNNGLGVLSGIVVPESTSPFTAVNKMYVDDAIANVGSGGGGGGVDYIIEEGSAQIKDAAGIHLSSKPAKYRKWNNGFVEVDASFDYAPSSCAEMANVYSLGSISFNIHDTSGSKKLFAGGVIQAYCSFNAIGSWCSCFAIGGESVDVVLNFYSAIPENTTPFTANVYIRGRWK